MGIVRLGIHRIVIAILHSVDEKTLLIGKKNFFTWKRSKTHSKVEWLSLETFSVSKFFIRSTSSKMFLFFQFLNNANILSEGNSVDVKMGNCGNWKLLSFLKQQKMAITTCNINFLFKNTFPILPQDIALSVRIVQNLNFTLENLPQLIAPRYPLIRFQISSLFTKRDAEIEWEINYIRIR